MLHKANIYTWPQVCPQRYIPFLAMQKAHETITRSPTIVESFGHSFRNQNQQLNSNCRVYVGSSLDCLAGASVSDRIHVLLHARKLFHLFHPVNKISHVNQYLTLCYNSLLKQKGLKFAISFQFFNVVNVTYFLIYFTHHKPILSKKNLCAGLLIHFSYTSKFLIQRIVVSMIIRICNSLQRIGK